MKQVNETLDGLTGPNLKPARSLIKSIYKSIDERDPELRDINKKVRPNTLYLQ